MHIRYGESCSLTGKCDWPARRPEAWQECTVKKTGTVLICPQRFGPSTRKLPREGWHCRYCDGLQWGGAACDVLGRWDWCHRRGGQCHIRPSGTLWGIPPLSCEPFYDLTGADEHRHPWDTGWPDETNCLLRGNGRSHQSPAYQGARRVWYGDD